MSPLEKENAVQSILDYVQILSMKGIDFSIPDKDALLNLEGTEIMRLLRQVKDLARTPTA